MSAKVIQVIETRLTTRGTGKDEASPMRGITQYWSLDGIMLAEVDPCPPRRRGAFKSIDPAIDDLIKPGSVVPCSPDVVSKLVSEVIRLRASLEGDRP